MIIRYYHCPCGELVLGDSGGFLCLCVWRDEADKTPLFADGRVGDTPLLSEACRQLDDYFSGARQSFSLPLCFRGTAFQQAAWRAMQTIPYGTVITYAEEAHRAGHPKAVRAIGNANHRNPLAVIVPCHRVVAAGGLIGGYSAGLDKKLFLLELERRHSARSRG